MQKLQYQKIKKQRNAKQIKEIWTNTELNNIKKSLKMIFDNMGDDVYNLCDWSEEELKRLKVIKLRKEKENHYNRFSKIK